MRRSWTPSIVPNGKWNECRKSDLAMHCRMHTSSPERIRGTNGLSTAAPWPFLFRLIVSGNPKASGKRVRTTLAVGDPR